MLKKVNMDPFSSGTEYDYWEARNCDRCVKSSRMKDDNEYTKIRCAIQRDIFTRMYSNEPIAQRTIDICRKDDCALRILQGEQHRKKYEKNKDYPKLFEQ